MLPKFGEPRLKFPPGEQKLLLEEILIKNSLNAKGLAKFVNLSPRTIRDWKREKFHMTLKALNLFKEKLHIKLPSDISKFQQDWEKDKLATCVEGGHARFKMYGNPATLEGCRRGGRKSLEIMREKGIIAPCKNFLLPKHKTAKLAEFIGIMLGDGHLSKWQASITLNSAADKNYINYIKRLGKFLFRDKPTIIVKKDCKAVDVRFSGIQLVNYLVKNGLKVGNKVKQQVSIPNWIQKSKSFKIACLRGLMDTDGCVAKCTHFYKSKRYIYYNHCFANRSKPILEFVTQTLAELGLHPSVAGERIWLYNKASVRDYFKIVGSSNYRLLKFQESIPIGSGKSLLNFDA